MTTGGETGDDGRWTAMHSVASEGTVHTEKVQVKEMTFVQVSIFDPRDAYRPGHARRMTL